jgi:hypothetical protein
MTLPVSLTFVGARYAKQLNRKVYEVHSVFLKVRAVDWTVLRGPHYPCPGVARLTMQNYEIVATTFRLRACSAAVAFADGARADALPTAEIV